MIRSQDREGGHRATGLTTKVKHPDAANALAKYLTLPSSVPVIQKNGMNPIDLRQ